MASTAEKLLNLSQRLLGVADRQGTVRGAPSEDSLRKYVQRTIEETAEDRADIQKLKDFYEGDQVRGTGLNNGVMYIPSWPDEEDEDKETRADRMEDLAWNRIRDGVLTHADALYAWGEGKGKTVNRSIIWDEDEPSDTDRRFVELFYHRKFARRNRLAEFMWEVWRTAGAERKCVVMLQWLDGRRRRLRRFGPSDLDPRLHRENGVVWLEKCDNLRCIVLPDPVTPREPGAVIRWYRRSSEDALNSSSQAALPWHRGTVTEFVTDDLWVRWNGTEREDTAWGGENRYGDLRSVFLVAENMGNLSDIEDAISPQTMLLEHLYNAAEVMRNHAHPDVLYRGYDPPTKEVNGREVLERGPNVAHVAADYRAGIDKVGPPARIADVGLQESQIHQMLDEALGMSIMERGHGSDLGQLRSAPALAKLSAKSERRRRRKIMAATRFEEELFESVMRVLAYHGYSGNQGEWLTRARVSVVFPEDAFTSDSFTETQEEVMEAGAGLRHRLDLLRERYPDLTETELQEKLEAINEDMETLDVQEPGRDPDPTPQTRSNVQPDSGLTS